MTEDEMAARIVVLEDRISKLITHVDQTHEVMADMLGVMDKGFRTISHRLLHLNVDLTAGDVANAESVLKLANLLAEVPMLIETYASPSNSN